MELFGEGVGRASELESRSMKEQDVGIVCHSLQSQLLCRRFLKPTSFCQQSTHERRLIACADTTVSLCRANTHDIQPKRIRNGRVVPAAREQSSIQCFVGRFPKLGVLVA
jgi:hypothetical protein